MEPILRVGSFGVHKQLRVPGESVGGSHRMMIWRAR